MIAKAIVRGFDSGTYTATVQRVGSVGTYLTGVAVARNIPAAEIVVGRTVAIAIYDDAQPADAVVIAVYA